MDDLSGLSWSNTTKTTQQAPKGTGNYYPTLRPTPSPAHSGISTPLSSQGSGNVRPTASISKSTTPANDSFSNLVSFGSSKASGNLSLQDQQRKLQAEKEKKAVEQKKQYDAQFGHTQFWDGMGKTSNSTSSISSLASPTVQAPKNLFSKPFSPPLANTVSGNSEDTDLFAAFNADAPVDNSSHYPPPAVLSSGRSTPQITRSPPLDLTTPSAWGSRPAASSALGDLGDDDDPFGLSQMAGKQNNREIKTSSAADEDDFLGDLGKPVEEVKRKVTPVIAPESSSSSSDDEQTESADPWDKAVRDIADMGFTEEQARRALTENGSGVSVQAAVSWLLNEAHRTAKNKSKAGQASQNEERHSSPNRQGSRAQQELPERSAPKRENSRSPANGENDLSKTAAAVGSNLFKTANSLWKTSQKKMQKAVSDFQTDSDSSRPKWMQEAAMDEARASQKPVNEGERRQRSPRRGVPEVTDEALMLESGGPPPRRSKVTTESRSAPPRLPPSRDHSPALSASTGRSTPQSRWQQSVPSSGLDPKSRLSKQAIEEQSAQAYVSPGRRKKVTPVPEPKDEPDLLFGSSQPDLPQRKKTSPLVISPRPTPTPVASKPSTPIPVKPKAPSRNIPALSPSALTSSNQHRLAGTAHFKRGDYASAHSSYSNSLSSLPPTHPITIILLCNRSLTALKTGDPKAAVADADNALTLIGPSRGENETINLMGSGPGEGLKDMKEFFGKALMRKAEALEQMERWADAGAVWKEAVEAGVGAATAIQGRARCEKALAPKPKPVAPRAQPARPRPSALSDFKQLSAQSIAAVNRLREANKAAEKADDEKFALSDAIEAKIEKWKGGKADNLRALLGSLDQVLWPEAGWKKVGLHELVMNNKVKIIYMKAIAKVHPDKISPTATTEVRMLSENVFSILNSAWDAFRKENGM